MKAGFPSRCCLAWATASLGTTGVPAATYMAERLAVPGYSATWGQAINNAGDVVLTTGANEASFLRRPSGVVTEIRYPGRSPTVALGINNLGTVVGDVWDPGTGSYIGFLMSPQGQFSTFRYPGAVGMQVSDINDAGVIVGGYYVSDADSGAFVRFPDGTFRTFRYHTDGSTIACGINEAGQICGWSNSGSFLEQTDGACLPLAVPDATSTYAWRINNEGQVVGYYFARENDAGRGFVRDRDGEFQTLEIVGLPNSTPFDINDLGQLVGNTVLEDRSYAFVATPVTEPPRIEKQPVRVVLHEGREARVAVQVSGVPEPVCQWYRGATALPDGTNATLVIPVATRAFEGLYTLAASNILGRTTSAPIVVVVSNLEPLRFPGWRWAGQGSTVAAERALTALGPWFEFERFPAGATSGFYVETNTAGSARFYRLRGDATAWFGATAQVPGWWYQSGLGSRHRIEYVWSGSGWTNWVVLTELTLPESPHLFLDTDAFDHPDAVYRTMPVP